MQILHRLQSRDRGEIMATSFDVETTIYVECAACGSPLNCKLIKTEKGYYWLDVEPCKNCMVNAKGDSGE
jgi:hypothetical protein